MIQPRDRPIACMSASLLSHCLSSSLSLCGHIFLFSLIFKLFCLLFYIQSFSTSSPETTSLHLYILAPFPSLHPVPLIFSSIIDHLSNNQEQISSLCPSSNLDISRSNFSSNGVTLVQRDISQHKDRKHDREAELKMAHSQQQQIHFNRIHEVDRKAQASFVCPRRVENQRGRYKLANTDLERQEEPASTGLTLPVSHENATTSANTQLQTLPDALSTSCLSCCFTDLCEFKKLYSQYKLY